jgi:hypothetical protein
MSTDTYAIVDICFLFPLFCFLYLIFLLYHKLKSSNQKDYFSSTLMWDNAPKNSLKKKESSVVCHVDSLKFIFLLITNLLYLFNTYPFCTPDHKNRSETVSMVSMPPPTVPRIGLPTTDTTDCSNGRGGHMLMTDVWCVREVVHLCVCYGVCMCVLTFLALVRGVGLLGCWQETHVFS